jgi:hypothetical protein
MTFKKKWGTSLIEKSYQEFMVEFGRQPTLMEIDSLKSFPSVKQIQRIYGSIKELRIAVGLTGDEVYLSSGSNRSRIAASVTRTSRETEAKLTNELIELFGEEFVHIERPVNYTVTTRNRFDCFVFSKTKQFAVDIFVTNTIPNLASNLHSKFIHYKNSREDENLAIYLVLVSESLNRGDIEKLVNSRKTFNVKNIKALTYSDFIDEMMSLEKHKIK